MGGINDCAYILVITPAQITTMWGEYAEWFAYPILLQVTSLNRYFIGWKLHPSLVAPHMEEYNDIPCRHNIQIRRIKKTPANVPINLWFNWWICAWIPGQRLYTVKTLFIRLIPLDAWKKQTCCSWVICGGRAGHRPAKLCVSFKCWPILSHCLQSFKQRRSHLVRQARRNSPMMCHIILMN